MRKNIRQSHHSDRGGAGLNIPTKAENIQDKRGEKMPKSAPVRDNSRYVEKKTLNISVNHFPIKDLES